MKQTNKIKTRKILPANEVLLFRNHLGESGYECSVDGCRDIWFYGDGDVRDFAHTGTVCATHGYLIPRMNEDEIESKQIGYFNASSYWIHQKSRFEIDMFPTIVYTSNGEQKEFISSEGQKQKDELDEFLKSRMK